MQQLIIKHWKRSRGPWCRKKIGNIKNNQTWNCKNFLLKLLKVVILKSGKNSTKSRRYTVTYYKTLEEVPWLLRLKKPKKWHKFSKNCKICQKIAKTGDNRKLKTITWTLKFFSVSYYQTLKEICDPWENLRNDNKSKKKLKKITSLLKIAEISDVKMLKTCPLPQKN